MWSGGISPKIGEVRPPVCSGGISPKIGEVRPPSVVKGPLREGINKKQLFINFRSPY